MRRILDLRTALLPFAPTALAFAVAGAGVMLLVSGATPSEPERFRWLAEHAPLYLIEASHFLSSIFGLVLVLLGLGLKQRLDAAWMASVVLLAAASALALLKGFNYEETLVLGGVLVALAPFHAAFPRQARLSRIEITPGWLVSVAAALAGAAVLGWWSFSNADYRGMQWWRVMADADADRAIRAMAGAGILFLALGFWRLFATPATPRVAGDQDPDFARVRAVLARAEVMAPDANLALLGDKRFLFSPSGESFLMFGVRGRSWIALGAPTGRRDEQSELLWRFRELADAHAARPGVYGFGAELLPDMVEMGMAVQKSGESATVPLEGFSLVGRKREVLRRNWRKAGEAGATFEVLPAGAAAGMIDELKLISDEWLAHHAGGEKGFSMGGFYPRYVCEFPLALVRMNGLVVAFATLWLTPASGAFSMDLMRYGAGAPKNVMDFLFVELIGWGRGQGFSTFEFGMAPLAGLADRPLAPFMSRIGRLLFDNAEEIYNFQGVRRYKDKYDPVWRPRYVAAPRKLAIPIILADVSLLSSGGMAGLAKRPRRETPRPEAQVKADPVSA